MKAALLDQRVVAGRRQHLRRRGALGARDPSAAAGRAPLARPRRARPRGRPRGARGRASRPRAPRSATSARPTAATARRRSASRPTAAAASPAIAAARRCGARSCASAGRRTARAASASSSRTRLRSSLHDSTARRSERAQLLEAADRLRADHDLRHGVAAGEFHQLLPEVRLIVDVDRPRTRCHEAFKRAWPGRTTGTKSSNKRLRIVNGEGVCTPGETRMAKGSPSIQTMQSTGSVRLPPACVLMPRPASVGGYRRRCAKGSAWIPWRISSRTSPSSAAPRGTPSPPTAAT